MTPLLLDAVAVYRLTRLATADTLTQPLRERVIQWAYVAQAPTPEMRRRLDEARAEKCLDGYPWGLQGSGLWDAAVQVDHSVDRPVPKLADLVTCRWCASVWLALFAVAARRLAPRLWEPLAKALAFSAAAALLAGLEE